MTNNTEYEELMGNIAQRVNAWDHENIEDLQGLLEEIPSDLPSDTKFYGVDMSSLPSEDIPDDIDTGYPVWAMDKHGQCLVGAAVDKIESLDEIRGIDD